MSMFRQAPKRISARRKKKHRHLPRPPRRPRRQSFFPIARLIRRLLMAKYQYATSPPNITTMPPGVPYIIGNEGAERFSFYGMRSILIIFMTHYLVTSAGAPDRMSDAEARQNFALFVSAVYFLPILGAI